MCSPVEGGEKRLMNKNPPPLVGGDEGEGVFDILRVPNETF